MARTAVSRTIAADPTSTALLLGGPTALEHWTRPGASVRLQSPWRTPTAYVSRLVVSCAGLPDASGLLTLAYDAHEGDSVRTAAALRLDWAASSDVAATAIELRGLAEELLAALADVAEERAFAA
ncbi:MAG TPA: hypothetical protein VNA14_09135 [Mycobacteriales bacterium]|nr:hypothetical protein [Mycobacteriales bacterium]